MAFFDFVKDIFGGDSKATEVKYPAWYSDPNFDSTQEFLKNYSQDLLTKGPNDYYAPIGQYGTPEFMDFIQSTNSKTMMGVDEALARSGRGRGGRGAEIAANTLGERNAALAYQDYLRAMQGRKDLLGLGINTQANVRDAGFMNQGAKNKFNVEGAEFDFAKGVYGDAFDEHQFQKGWSFMSDMAPIVGAGIGFAAGGPGGAAIGSGIGSSMTGGSGKGPQWLDLISQGKTKTPGTATENATPGVSNIGKINADTFDIAKLIATLAVV